MKVSISDTDNQNLEFSDEKAEQIIFSILTHAYMEGVNYSIREVNKNTDNPVEVDMTAAVNFWIKKLTGEDNKEESK